MSQQNRQTLKSYFETGDKPTEDEFGKLIDSYAQLNEFNFGLDVKPSGKTYKKYYHVYRSVDLILGIGHKIIEGNYNETPPSFNGYNHVLSDNIRFKKLNIKLVGSIDINLHQPKLIIERYKQRKKLRSGYIKPAGFYQEKEEDSTRWNRQSEYDINSNSVEIDINPFQYFRPGPPRNGNSINNFLPSGSISRFKSFKYSNHDKPFVPLQLRIQIRIQDNHYISQPVKIKLILGINENDSINFVFD